MLLKKILHGALPAVLIHISIGSVYAWSLLVNPISQETGYSPMAIQFAFSLAIFFLGMSAAFGGRLVEKYIDFTTKLSATCFISGLVMTAFAIAFKNLILMYLGYGCLMGIGLGIGYLSPIKTLMIWFKDNKGLATGIAVCAFGFASSIASPLITFLMQHFALYAVFIILASIYTIPMIIGERLLKKPDDYVEITEEENNDFELLSMFRDRKFRIFWIVIFLNITGGLALISVASPLLELKNIAPHKITFVVSMMGLFNGLGRIALSTISDKFKSRINMYIIISISSTLGVLLALHSHNIYVIVIVFCLISMCYGAGFSCLPAALSDIYGMKNISKIHGLILSAWGIAGLLGNQISSIVYKINNDYDLVFAILAIMYIVEFASLINLKFYSLKKEEV